VEINHLFSNGHVLPIAGWCL